MLSRLSRPSLRPLRAAVFMLIFCGMAAHAGVAALVLSEGSAPYHEAADAIEAALGPQHTVVRILADKLPASASALSRAGFLVAIGVRAADLVAGQGGDTPVLAVLVTEDWYRSQGKAKLSTGGRSVGALVLEQPFSRQMELARKAFPRLSRIGVVLGRKNAGMLGPLQAAASKEGVTLVGAVSESESTLVATLEQVLREAELLLAVPDAEVLNRSTAQSVLMTTYRYRDPMIGYSKALSRAGALVSLYSTPEQIGRQAGEIAARAMGGARLPELQWPQYFSVSVNRHVARSLGVDVPPEDVLLAGLGGQ